MLSDVGVQVAVVQVLVDEKGERLVGLNADPQETGDVNMMQMTEDYEVK